MLFKKSPPHIRAVLYRGDGRLRHFFLHGRGYQDGHVDVRCIKENSVAQQRQFTPGCFHLCDRLYKDRDALENATKELVELLSYPRRYYVILLFPTLIQWHQVFSVLPSWCQMRLGANEDFYKHSLQVAAVTTSKLDHRVSYPYTLDRIVLSTFSCTFDWTMVARWRRARIRRRSHWSLP